MIDGRGVEPRGPPGRDRQARAQVDPAAGQADVAGRDLDAAEVEHGERLAGAAEEAGLAPAAGDGEGRGRRFRGFISSAAR